MVTVFKAESEELSTKIQEKAESSIVSIPSGITIEDNEMQCQYLQPIITQYFIDNKSEIWLLFLIAHSKR